MLNKIFRIFGQFVEMILFRIMSKFLDVKESRILFYSYCGNPTKENPGAIFSYIVKNYQYECILVFSSAQNIPRLTRFKSTNVVKVRRRSLSFLYYLSTSKYWIVDTHFPCYFSPKQDQILIQTWHAAGAFKKFGMDIENRTNSGKLLRLKNQVERQAKNISYLICSSSSVKSIYARALNVPTEKVIVTGLPRTDFLFEMLNKKEKYLPLIFKELNLPRKKVLLYAPTFRDHKPFELKIDLNLLKKKLSDKFVLLLKLHVNDIKRVKKRTLQTLLKEYENFLYDVSSYDSLKLLLVADILVTDYSSIIFDYSLLEKPMIFYPYDLEEYKMIRGFYYEYEKFVPGPIVHNTEELIEIVIKGSFNVNIIREFAKKFHEHFDGKVSERVVQLLILNKGLVKCGRKMRRNKEDG